MCMASRTRKIEASTLNLPSSLGNTIPSWVARAGSRALVKKEESTQRYCYEKACLVKFHKLLGTPRKVNKGHTKRFTVILTSQAIEERKKGYIPWLGQILVSIW